VKNQLQQQLAMMDQAESKPMPIQFAGVSANAELVLDLFYFLATGYDIYGLTETIS